MKKRDGQSIYLKMAMIGLNDKLLQQYVEWVANRRIRAIGFKPIYDVPAKKQSITLDRALD